MKMVLAAAALTAVAASVAFAQQKAPSEEATTFAKKVAAANTFEIQSSQVAGERGRSAEVKSFAKQMVDDHAKAGAEFKSALQAANLQPPPEEPDETQKATLSRLRSSEGAAFDRAYASAQLQAHQDAVALFRSYAQGGRTAPLKEFAQKTLPTLEHHLEMARRLDSQVKAEGRARADAPKEGTKPGATPKSAPPARTAQRTDPTAPAAAPEQPRRRMAKSAKKKRHARAHHRKKAYAQRRKHRHARHRKMRRHAHASYGGYFYRAGAAQCCCCCPPMSRHGRRVAYRYGW